MGNFLLILLISILSSYSSIANAITFAQVPLNLPQNPPANLLFSLSVEFPTGNVAAYATSAFNSSTLYDGYFDSNKCYTYVVNNSPSPGNLSSTTPNEYFQAAYTTSSSNNYQCNGSTRAWSGNFLNWLTMTKLDLFRKALTGGTREFDSTTQTFLLRTFIDGHGGLSTYPDINVSSSIVQNYTAITPVQSYIIANLSISNYGQSCRDGCNTSEIYGSRFRIIDPNNANESNGVHNGSIAFPYNIPKVSILVCDPSISLEKNCTSYTSNNTTYYKPEGFIQKNQKNIRYGAFSYAPVNYLDQREGGLMREPLKSVGPQSYVGTNNLQANSNPEINSSNGVFIFDPDGIYTQAPKSNSISDPIYSVAQSNWNNSGLINYINQFGYRPVSSLGGWHYIQYDNIAELYYETIRYLSLAYNGSTQSATPEYTKNIQTGQSFSSTVSDGFPLVTQYTDPIVDKCQSNYVVFLSDANTWCDGRVPGGIFYNGQQGSNGTGGQCANGNTPVSNPIPNLNTGLWMYWAEYYDYGYYYADYDPDLSCPGGARGCSPNVPNIAGLSYWAHVNDIRPDLDGFQSITTFVMDVHEQTGRTQNGASPDAFGQDPTHLWLAAKYGGFTFNDSTGWDYNPNDNPTSWDSNGDGVPDTFLKGDSTNIQSSLQQLFTSVAATKINSANGHIAVSTPINPQNTQVYQAFYANPSAGQWEGNVMMAQPSISTNSNGQITYSLGGSQNFTQGAAGWLSDTTVGGQQPRQIITAVRSQAGGVATGTAFQWNSIGAYTQNLLIAQNENNATGNLRLNYVRGDRSNEISTSNPNGFRIRPATVLGDIIDSSPVYVGPAIDGYSDSDFPAGTPSYGAFAQGTFSRPPMVYVGSNDGMLHGFDGTTLKEVFAFIPNSVLGNFLTFSSPTYVHNYFVDETPIIADVPVPSKGWTTQLIGFPGVGGTGVFALDITSPNSTRANVNLSQAENNANNIVLWELNSQTDNDIGFILNRGQTNRQHNNLSTQVGRLANGRWAVLTGNGYNSPNNSTGLLVIYLDSTNGTPSYQKIMISGATGGLSAPTPVDVNNDGIIDYAYAGDLAGNLWRFDLRSANPAQWSAFKLFTAIDTNNGWGGGGTNLPQPISTAPAITWPCTGQGLMVYFGTGSYFSTSDNSLNEGQSLYALWDKLNTTPITKSQLAVQMYAHWAIGNGNQSEAGTNNLSNILGFTTNNPVDWTQVQGWEWDGIGDKIIVPPYVVKNVVYFSTIIPVAAVSSNSCQASGFWNNFFALDACSGNSLATNIFDTSFTGKADNTFKVNGQVFSQLTDAWNNNQIDTNYVDSSVWLNPQVFTCTTPPCSTLQTDFISGVGIGVDTGNLLPHRLSWREIMQ